MGRKQRFSACRPKVGSWREAEQAGGELLTPTGLWVTAAEGPDEVGSGPPVLDPPADVPSPTLLGRDPSFKGPIKDALEQAP